MLGSKVTGQGVHGTEKKRFGRGGIPLDIMIVAKPSLAGGSFRMFRPKCGSPLLQHIGKESLSFVHLPEIQLQFCERSPGSKDLLRIASRGERFESGLNRAFRLFILA